MRIHFHLFISIALLGAALSGATGCYSSGNQSEQLVILGDASSDTGAGAGGEEDAMSVVKPGDARCGDGAVSAGEQCDGSQLAGQTCQALGFDGGNLGCTDACRLDTSGCTGKPEACGDGNLDTNEECEGFELRGQTCEDLGFHGGQLKCSNSCRLDTSACDGRCGDGELNGPEICDDGVNDGTHGSCSKNCMQRMPYCGDGKVNGPETCDGDVPDGASCHGVASCSSSCDIRCDKFVDVDSGDHHSCAKTSGGQVICWGSDFDGESESPSGSFEQISTGDNFNCGVTKSGGIKCWGSNDDGQSSPPSGDYKMVSAGSYHACAVASDGKLKCWGEDRYGETSPPSGRFKTVAAGRHNSCAVTKKGQIRCWGSEHTDIVRYAPNGTFKQVTLGEEFGCALKTDGTIRCWGAGGGDVRRSRITPPSGTFVEISSSDVGTCARRQDNTLECWGGRHDDPAKAISGTFVSVGTGYRHTCAVEANGGIECWGNNDRGQTDAP